MRVIQHSSKSKADYVILAEGVEISLVRLRTRGVLPERFSGGDKAVGSVLQRRRYSIASENDLRHIIDTLP